MLQQALGLFRQAEDEPGQIETLIAECWRLGDMIDPAILEELAAKIERTPQLVRADQVASYHAAAQWYYLIHDHDWQRVTHHLLASFESCPPDRRSGRDHDRRRGLRPGAAF